MCGLCLGLLYCLKEIVKYHTLYIHTLQQIVCLSMIYCKGSPVSSLDVLSVSVQMSAQKTSFILCASCALLRIYLQVSDFKSFGIGAKILIISKGMPWIVCVYVCVLFWSNRVTCACYTTLWSTVFYTCILYNCILLIWFVFHSARRVVQYLLKLFIFRLTACLSLALDWTSKME